MNRFLGTGLSVLAFYLFLTRMHKSVFSHSPPFAADAFLSTRVLWAIFGMLSLMHFLNVYYVYINFTEGNYLRVGGSLTGSTAGCSFSPPSLSSRSL